MDADLPVFLILSVDLSVLASEALYVAFFVIPHSCLILARIVSIHVLARAFAGTIRVHALGGGARLNGGVSGG